MFFYIIIDIAIKIKKFEDSEHINKYSELIWQLCSMTKYDTYISGIPLTNVSVTIHKSYL